MILLSTFMMLAGGNTAWALSCATPQGLATPDAVHAGIAIAQPNGVFDIQVPLVGQAGPTQVQSCGSANDGVRYLVVARQGAAGLELARTLVPVDPGDEAWLQVHYAPWHAAMASGDTPMAQDLARQLLADPDLRGLAFAALPDLAALPLDGTFIAELIAEAETTGELASVALVLQGSPDATPWLLDMLNHPDDSVRVSGVSSIRPHHDVDAAWWTQLLFDADMAVTHAALRVLPGHPRAPEIVPELEELIRNPKGLNQLTAATEALAIISPPHMQMLLDDPTVEINDPLRGHLATLILE